MIQIVVSGKEWIDNTWNRILIMERGSDPTNPAKKNPQFMKTDLIQAAK